MSRRTIKPKPRQAAAAPTQALLKGVLDHVSEAIFTVDLQGNISSWNRGAENLLGYQEDQIVGSSCTVISGTSCLGRSCKGAHLSCPLFSNDGVWSRRCVVRHRSGRQIAVLKNGQLIRDDRGRVIGGVETLTDVTSLVLKHGAGSSQELDSFRDRAAPLGACGDVPGRRQMVGQSEPMVQARELAGQAAASDVSVLITGESGTGKELLAEAIRAAGPWADAPFVRVDCASLSESLLESELFGHARGAFTGAVGKRVGRFELANGGILFLDEVGDISASAQKKLLRFLQSREFERVGENVTRKVNVRVISATNRDLHAMVGQGSFREDLFWRLSAFPIQLPPLRDRMDDVLLLARHFLDAHWRRNRSSPPPRLSAGAQRALVAHAWPGNCRELENVMWYASTVAAAEQVLLQHLPPYLRSIGARSAGEEQYVRDALDRCQWNRTRAAKMLGISRSTLWRQMKRLSLDPPLSG